MLKTVEITEEKNMKKQLAIVFAAALVAVASVGCSKKTEVTTEE